MIPVELQMCDDQGFMSEMLGSGQPTLLNDKLFLIIHLGVSKTVRI